MKTKVVREMTFAGIRAVLSEEIEKLRTGKTTAGNISAMSNAIGKYLSSVKVQLEVAKIVGKAPQIAGLIDQDTAATSGAPVATKSTSAVKSIAKNDKAA